MLVNDLHKLKATLFLKKGVGLTKVEMGWQRLSWVGRASRVHDRGGNKAALPTSNLHKP